MGAKEIAKQIRQDLPAQNPMIEVRA